MTKVDVSPVTKPADPESQTGLRSLAEIRLFSLESVYVGYIEACLRFDLLDLFPVHVGNDERITRYFDTFPGLRARIGSISVIAHQAAPEDFLIPTTLDTATQDMLKYERGIKKAYQVAGLSDNEAFKVFDSQIREVLAQPPIGYQGDTATLAEALSHIPDAVTGEAVGYESLLEEVGATDKST